MENTSVERHEIHSMFLRKQIHSLIYSMKVTSSPIYELATDCELHAFIHNYLQRGFYSVNYSDCYFYQCCQNELYIVNEITWFPPFMLERHYWF